jgi:hypothetical protein
MAKIHEIGIGADTRAFEQGIKSGVIDPVEQATDAMDRLEDATGGAGKASSKAGDQVDTFADKLADAARKAGKSDDEIRDALRQMGVSADDARRAVDKLGAQFADTGREGERGVDKLEDALRDAQREAKRTEDAVDDVGEGGRRGFRKMGDAGNEVSGELRQNLGETFSSFRGDLEDLPQVAQDVFGGLAGSVDSLTGSIGLAAGAAGVGLLIAAIQNANAEQEKIKERASEWASGFIEAGGRVLSFQERMAGINDVITNQYDEAKKNAENWGVSVQTAAAAMSGSEEAISRAQAGIDKMTAGAEALAATGGTVTDQFGNITTAGSDLAGMAVAGQSALDGFKSSLSQAKDMAGASALAMIDQARATQGATEAVDEFGDTVITLPDGKQVYIDAETGQATQDVDAIDQKIYGIRDGHSTVTVTADTSDVDRAMRRLSGTTLKIGARIVTSGSGWDQ